MFSSQSSRARRKQSVPPPATPQQPSKYEAPATQPSKYEAARAELTQKLIAEGVDQKRAERVAEATIRRAKAKEGRTVFHYADVENEFEQRCRSTGADPLRIEATKRRVWTAARATAQTHGLPLEEALFFCYREGIDVHSEFLVAVSGSDEETPPPGS